MKAAAVPANEAARLEALHRYAVLDTADEAAFDALTRLAAHVAGTPIALVSLIDADRQWFKSRYGLDVTETARDISFCAHVVESEAALQVKDTFEDSRFADNPLVTGEPKIRFYMGTPLRTTDGFVLGTLCALDRQPRELASEQIEMLKLLAHQATDQLELRRRNISLATAIANRQADQQERDRLFAVAHDLICTAGADGFFRMVNPAFTRLLGFSSSELLAKPFIEFCHPDDREETLTAIRRIERGEEIIDFENRFRTVDGRFVPLVWRATPDRTTGLMCATARDVTDLKRTQRELELARDNAQRANQAKSAFLANMSHELRTPLNSVIGFSALLLKNKAGTLTEQQLNYLSRVQDNGSHLLGLINDVLDLAKVESGAMELTLSTVSLTEIVTETVAILEPALHGRPVHLTAEVPANVARIETDRTRLKQVLINLAANAVKFTKEGNVTVRVVTDPATHVPVRIDVIDSGIGIPLDRQDAIFESFQQADNTTTREFGGTGLGLAISRALARHLGFDVGLQSAPGHGSVFSIHFVPRVLPANGVHPT